MKKSSVLFLTPALTALLIFTLPAVAITAQPQGLEIAKIWDAREDGDDTISTSIFILENRRGQKRIRKTVRYWKDYDGRDGVDEKTLIFFKSPSDIKGTGFLNLSYENLSRDDDKWLYLPALKKIKRIASDNKDDYFMGTDLTFDDMGDRKVEEDNFRLIREEQLDGKECYLLEAVPKEKDYMYSKRLIWIDKADLIDYQTLFFDRKGRELKKMRTEWTKVEDIWAVKRISVENYSNKHKTTIEIDNIKMNPGVKESTFRKSALKRGVR